MLGIRTLGGRIVGADYSTELWWPSKGCICSAKHFGLNEYFHRTPEVDVVNKFHRSMVTLF